MAQIPVEFLFKKLVDLLLNEVRLQRSVRPELEHIKLELQNMRSFLKDADSKAEKDGEVLDSVKEWVEQVRATAYDIEDIVDEFMLIFGGCGPYQVGNTLAMLFRRLNSVAHPFERHELGRMIRDMKKRISDISKRKDRYELRGLVEGASSTTAENQHLTATNEAYIAEDSEVEGIQDDINKLTNWANVEDPRLNTILLVGMGGSGKTNLARQVYQKLKDEKKFDRYAWVPITQSFNAGLAFRRLLDELQGPEAHQLLAGRDVTSLGEEVRRQLQDKKYVIVLDDVWSNDVLNTISFAFPKRRCQCRLIITSRLENVASGIGIGTERPTEIYRLKPLPPKESMQLFCRYAFRNSQLGECECPEHLQEICEKLVDRCNGLPLALVCLGANISGKERSQLAWTSFHDGLSWELSANPELGRIRGIFFLSYDELPIHLKVCLLYCVIFPKNYLIMANRLVRLWVSEGFVEEQEGMTVEQVGKQYLEELTRRSLLLVVERNEKGRIKTCQMHELLRELLMPISKRQGLSKIIYESNGSQDHTSGSERSRSLSFVGAIPLSVGDIYLSDQKKAQRVRSLFMFDSPCIFSMVHRFILMRVLDLHGVFIEELPDSIGHLYHLRYLNLRKTNLRKIPRSLGKLHNLQALDIRDNQIERLPNLSKVRKLRYVSAYSHVIHPFTIGQLSGCEFPDQICMSESLQKLSGINATNTIVEKIGNLTQLKNLGIFRVTGKQGDQLCRSIEKMKDLLALGISSAAEGECLSLDTPITPPPHLEDIWLFGRMDCFPKWMEQLNNIRRLGLYFSKLPEAKSPFSCLQGLPNLEWLKLYDAYDGREIKCLGTNSFPKLKSLMIMRLGKLRSIIVEDGALSQLQTLSICECPELKRMPDRTHLTNLQNIYLTDMPHYTVTSIPEQREDHYFSAKIHLYKGVDGRFYKQVLN